MTDISSQLIIIIRRIRIMITIMIISEQQVDLFHGL